MLGRKERKWSGCVDRYLSIVPIKGAQRFGDNKKRYHMETKKRRKGFCKWGQFLGIEDRLGERMECGLVTVYTGRPKGL